MLILHIRIDDEVKDLTQRTHMNWFRTTLLLAAMTGLFLAVGYLIGGATGMVIAFVVAAGMNVFAYGQDGPADARRPPGQPRRCTRAL